MGDPRDILRTLADEELAKVRAPTEAEIRAAFDRGREEMEAHQRLRGAMNISPGLRFR